MPITAVGCLAKNFTTWPRFSVLRSTTSPAALRPCTSNTDFARSSPIMIALSMDGPLLLVTVFPTTTSLAHRCRVGAVHTIIPSAARDLLKEAHCADRRRSLAALGMTVCARDDTSHYVAIVNNRSSR